MLTLLLLPLLSPFLLPSALAAPAGLTLLPLGIGVYAHKKPLRGAAYTVTQGVGIGVLSWATVQAYDAAASEDSTSFARYQAISVGAVSLAAASYLVSVLDGGRLHELEAEGEQARLRVQAWDAAQRVVVERVVVERVVLEGTALEGR